jgi:hypothetical protein
MHLKMLQQVLNFFGGNSCQLLQSGQVADPTTSCTCTSDLPSLGGRAYTATMLAGDWFVLSSYDRKLNDILVKYIV